MEPKKSIRNREGVCRKIYNALCHFRATIRRISPQPRGSILSETHAKIISNNNIPVVHKSKMIPNDFGSPARDEEITIAFGQKSAGSTTSRKSGLADQAGDGHPVASHVSFAKAMSKKDDDPTVHEDKFMDYINKVKTRMMKAMSNVGHEKSA